ncbi:MAG: helix-turn-helix domain-containing protein [Planctomycetota bacterium]|jgi:AraC-like DNA-binding protein
MRKSADNLIDTPPGQIRLHLCRCRRLHDWGHQGMQAPFWRCYIPWTEGGAVSYAEKRVSLTPDHAYLIPPYTAFDAVADGPFTKSWTHFSLEYPRACFRPGIYAHRLPLGGLEALEACCQGPNAGGAFRFHALHLECVGVGLSRLPESVISFRTVDDRIEAACNLIRARFDQPPPNGELARAAGLEESSFIRLFSRMLGEGPQGYGRRLRLEHAAELLTTGGQSVEQIAVACGFWDRNHLTHAFRRLWGLPPATFRRIHGGG